MSFAMVKRKQQQRQRSRQTKDTQKKILFPVAKTTKFTVDKNTNEYRKHTNKLLSVAHKKKQQPNSSIFG